MPTWQMRGPKFNFWLSPPPHHHKKHCTGPSAQGRQKQRVRGLQPGGLRKAWRQPVLLLLRLTSPTGQQEKNKERPGQVFSPPSFLDCCWFLIEVAAYSIMDQSHRKLQTARLRHLPPVSLLSSPPLSCKGVLCQRISTHLTKQQLARRTMAVVTATSCPGVRKEPLDKPETVPHEEPGQDS